MTFIRLLQKAGPHFKGAILKASNVQRCSLSGEKLYQLEDGSIVPEKVAFEFNDEEIQVALRMYSW